MTLSLIDNDAALHALGPAWDALWARLPGATPFQSPRWLLPWWRQFGTGRPHVATLHRDGELAGVLPLYVYQERLLPIGAGTSDCLDALAVSDEDAASLLAHALGRASVDACDLIELPPEAHLLHAPAPWPSETREAETCPTLSLSSPLSLAEEPARPGPSRLTGVIPPRMLRKLRMSHHRADRAGGVAFTTADVDTLAALYTHLQRLHQDRWTSQGEPGSFAAAEVVAMHAECAPSMLQAGLLRLGAAHLRGEVAAVILALLSPGRIHFYASGFDPTFSFESPGTLLLGHMLDQAMSEGRQEACFLRGGEAYKYAWGATDRRNCTRLLRRTPWDGCNPSGTPGLTAPPG